MPIRILMPALSPTMTEGNLARWVKNEGDTIKAGEVIAEIETDKATMEVEAVDEGVLGKILIASGTQGVAVNTPIALLLEDGEDASALATPANQNPPPTAPTTPTAAAVPAVAPTVPSPAKPIEGGRVFASPLAKKIAEELQVDLSRLTGTGPGGRIVRADVEAAATPQGQAKPMVAMPAANPAAAPSVPAGGMNVADYAMKLGMGFTALPNSQVRRVIARRLLESKQTVPHFYLTIDCQIDELLALRAKVNASAGIKISVNDLVIKAVALALRAVPAANVSWTDEAILQYGAVDVSVAVATPNGLITPVVKNADLHSLSAVAAVMKDLATRARDGKLRPEEFQGGGFTISNLGMYGIRDFAAIINPPQACILAVGAGEARPVVRDGAIVPATVMTCTLSVDHRAVDGAVGAEFLAAFKGYIEAPLRMVV